MLENIIAAITVAFAAFCVIWAFIRQLNSDDEGGCSGKCGGCQSNQKDGSNQSPDDDASQCDGPKA
ncbi:MAG: FeoB-associated Cys-rich membrane protein [Planctomycetes bacterium]|nr:FeoB-associated Cys-rich membrane protein [Planctomycetota bacterium]